MKISELIDVLNRLHARDGDMDIKIETPTSWDAICIVYAHGQMNKDGTMEKANFITISPFTLDQLKARFPPSVVIDNSR